MKKIEDIVTDDELLEKSAPLLHSISKENPFSVPKNYFDSLPSQIIERCHEKEVISQWSMLKENLRLFLMGYKWRLLSITTCVALICFFTLHIDTRAVSYQALAQNIPDSLIVAHFDKNITEVTISALEDITEDSSFAQVERNIVSSTKNITDSTGTDQDIIAYLINHNVTVSDIENQP
jgi:hypothetical protein